MSSTPDRADRAATQAMATGALNMAFFGAVWTAAGSGGIGGAAGVGVLVVGWTLAVVLCVGSVRLRRGARALPRDDSLQVQARRRSTLGRFNLVFGLEFLAIAVAVFLLVRLGLQSWIPSVVALIVGIHFFPLAELFGARVYHLTGALLCVLALVAFLLAPGSRLALVGVGSAATLFATSAYVLLVGARATRSPPPEG